MSSGFYPTSFYDKTDMYERIVLDLAYYADELSRTIDAARRLRYDLCPCCGGTRRPDFDREDFPDTEEGAARYTRSLEYLTFWDARDAEGRAELEELCERETHLKAHIKELEELRQIMFDNGEERKLALLAWVMKRKK